LELQKIEKEDFKEKEERLGTRAGVILNEVSIITGELESRRVNFSSVEKLESE
jgi:hypothetical protein